MINSKCHFQHVYWRVTLFIEQSLDTDIIDAKAIDTLFQFKAGHDFYKCTKYCGADKQYNRP
jgi:hypothetical protein